jgi:hypothetical protein
MYPPKPTHIYIGRDAGGCCLAIRNDYGDKDTGQNVAQMIESGLAVERVDWETYVGKVSNEPTFMNCNCKPPEPEPELQPALFAD